MADRSFDTRRRIRDLAEQNVEERTVAERGGWRISCFLSILLLSALVACTTPETAQPVPTHTPVLVPTPQPTIPIATPAESATHPIVPLPLDPLLDAPRIGPENAWSLRRIGWVPGQFIFSPTMEHLQWNTETDIKILDTEGGSLIISLPSVTLVTFSPDGQRLAWADGEGMVRVRDLTGGSEDLQLEMFSPECCLQLTFSPGGRMLLVRDRDPASEFAYRGVVTLMDLQEEQELFSWDDHDWAEFSPGGNTIGLQSSRMIGVTIWDVERLAELETISGFSTAAPVYAVRFSPDWRSLAFWARAGGDLYDVSTGLKKFDFIGEPMRFTPDGRTLATSETGWMSSECTGSVCLYDVETGAIRAILPHGYAVWNMEISPDGGLLVTAKDNRVRLWDVSQGIEIANLHVKSGNVGKVAFSPDGRYLLAYAQGSDSGGDVVELWAVDTTASATRIEFEPGATTWSTETPTTRGETQRFALYALAGQTMQVFVSGKGTSLTIRTEDGSMLMTSYLSQDFWRGKLPLSQDYFIELDTLDLERAEESVSMSIAIAPSGQESQSFSYSDPGGYFELEFSDYFAIDMRPRLNPILKGEELLRLAFVGTEFYDGTTLQEAFVAIARSDDPEIVANCSDAIDPYEQDQGRETISGHSYSKWSASDGGMGQFYFQTAYRTGHEGACYEVILYENALVAEHFAPELLLKEFDRADLVEKMRDILHTLNLLG